MRPGAPKTECPVFAFLKTERCGLTRAAHTHFPPPGPARVAVRDVEVSGSEPYKLSIANYAEAIGRELGYVGEDLDVLTQGVFFHDHPLSVIVAAVEAGSVTGR